MNAPTSGAELVEALRRLPYKTPSLVSLLEDQALRVGDDFFQHLLDLATPGALAYSRIMATHDGNPQGIEYKHSERDAWAFVLPDVSEGNDAYRVQYFDADGFASHHPTKTMEAAVIDMVMAGFVVETSGALDQMATTPRWKRGITVAGWIQELNAGEITHREFLERQRNLPRL